jgi:neutral ceramidase
MKHAFEPVPASMRLLTYFSATYLLASISLSTAQTSPSASSGVKAGFAERDITPGIGMEQPGGYGKSYHRSFHDACKVRVAVFDDGKKKAAIIGVDALVMPRQVTLDARAQIEKATGISGDAVLICASHSHSSGPVGMVMPHEYDGASDLVRRLAYEESSCADPGYLLRLTSEIVAGVIAADSARQPAHLGFGYGHEDKVGFNRRLRMKNGQSWSHPRPGNPDILEYAGPIDPQVGVIGAWDAQGQLLGVVVNYACHATTNPGGISANWVQYLESTIQGGMGTRAPIVFMQGACGDITQVDNLTPFATPKPEEWSRLVGGRVGAEAIRVLLSMSKTSTSGIAARQEVLKIRRRPPSAQRIAKALEIVSQPRPAGDTTDWLFAKEIVMLDHLVKTSPLVDCEVQCIQVGPACFVSNPAEYFVQYGLDIKKGSHHAFTFPCELSNGIVGYVPTEEAFGPNGGGYETRLTSYSNLEITAGTQMARKGIELANQMPAEPAPSPPKALPFKNNPWTYGNVKPELE